MTQDNPEQRINRLEMLFSEQEYTIETLNEIVTRQSSEISRLTAQLGDLKQQFKDMREQLPDNIAGHEKPPHY
jgi:uncharacterized coiled-coil protein SlyX